MRQNACFNLTGMIIMYSYNSNINNNIISLKHEDCNHFCESWVEILTSQVIKKELHDIFILFLTLYLRNDNMLLCETNVFYLFEVYT